MSHDPTTELTRRLSAILEACKRVKKPLDSYLKDTDERPDLDKELLSILSNALAAHEIIDPDTTTGEIHGLPREVCAIDVPLDIRHTERDEAWDFKPWLSEKLNSLQKTAKSMVQYWLTDYKTVTLTDDAPMTPKEWVRDGILSGLFSTEQYALTVFKEVCMDKLEITEKKF